MTIEQRLEFAVADVESEMRSGVSFESATASIALEYDIPLEGLLAELRRKYGAQPGPALAFRIEETEQQAALAYIWKIHQALRGRNINESQNSAFRNEIWKQVDAKIEEEFDSLNDMKARTSALKELKAQYDYWLGRRAQLTETPPAKPTFLKRLDDLSELIDRNIHDHS